MVTRALVLAVSAISFQPDTTHVLGMVERDLTGDGKPEILRLVGVGPTIDNLDVTFTIESSGRVIYRFQLEKMTRTVGIDGNRHVISAEAHRRRLAAFDDWFFGNEKFVRPAEFLIRWHQQAPDRAAAIPDVIAGDRPPTEKRDGRAIWDEIQNSPVTIFEFSPGGDGLHAIGWSARAARFYRLVDCC